MKKVIFIPCLLLLTFGSLRAQFRESLQPRIADGLTRPQLVSVAHDTVDSTIYAAPPHSMVKSSKVYCVNPWVSGAITVAGAGASVLALGRVRFKPAVTDLELSQLNPGLLNPADRWAINLVTPNPTLFENYSLVTQVTTAALPLSLLFMDRISQDWGNVLLMYAEINSVSVALYIATPLGPLFQNKLRPFVYETSQSLTARHDGNNRNSFYSGHVATAAADAFFFAKVYTDYHPELGADKYWFYAAAMIPPLTMGYFRLKAYDHFPSDIMVGMGIGALTGIMIPELHRIKCENLSFGVYGSPSSAGLTMNWDPNWKPED